MTRRSSDELSHPSSRCLKNRIRILQVLAVKRVLVLLHAQVSGGRSLTGAAGDRRHRQAAEQEVHGGQQGLQETHGAESGASVGGEVDFIGVRAGRLEERFVLTGRHCLLTYSNPLAAFWRFSLERVGFAGSRRRRAALQQRRIQCKRRKQR